MKQKIWVLAGLMVGATTWAQTNAPPAGTFASSPIGAPMVSPQSLAAPQTPENVQTPENAQIDPFNNQPVKVDALISDYQKLKIEEKISGMRLKKQKDEAEMALLPYKVMKAKAAYMPPPPPQPVKAAETALSHPAPPPPPILTLTGIMNSGKARSAIVQWRGGGHVVRSGSQLAGGLYILSVGSSTIRYSLHHLVHEVALNTSPGRFAAPTASGSRLEVSGGEGMQGGMTSQALQNALIRQQAQAGAPNGVMGLPPMQTGIPTTHYQ